MPPMRPAGPPAEADLRACLLEAIPALRAFAHSLTDDGDRGDDLVQDTLLRAWSCAEPAAHGDVTAWLFAILHRRFYAERPRAFERAARDASRTEPLEFREALRRLPDTQREALLLVEAQRFSYGEAAAICGVAVGTLKSRVARARTRLAAELGSWSLAAPAPAPGRSYGRS